MMAGDFFGGPCTRGGMVRAECCTPPTSLPQRCVRLGAAGEDSGRWDGCVDSERLNSPFCTTAHMRAAGGGGGAAPLMSETASSRQQPASPSSSSLPPPAALLRGRGVQALYVTRGNFSGRGVRRRGGVCVKAETLTLEERLGLGAWWGAAEGQPGFLPAPTHGRGRECALA